MSTSSYITKKNALTLATAPEQEAYELFYQANQIRQRYRSNRIDLCSIVSAKTGGCTEDCSFCAQSRISTAEIKKHSLLSKEEVIKSALSSKANGARRFCVVTSGRTTSKGDFYKIMEMVALIRETGILPCATLGLLTDKELGMLKEAGLERYHHNLETSEDYFTHICSTHTYKDKIDTINSALTKGLSVCSGGIFGLGETWEDRIEMAFALSELNVDSVPINFISPISGTPLGNAECLQPLEALKIIALYRLILPSKEIRVCGGRFQTLRQLNSFVFFAGADALLIGNYLTTTGTNPLEDIQLIKDLGLDYEG